MYYQNEVDSADKKQRTRIIAIATFVAVVILLLIVAIIVTATSKSAKNNTAEKGIDEPTTVVAEAQPSEDGGENDGNSIGTISTETEDEQSNNGGADVSISANANVSVEVVDTSDKMPTTGPEDVLPIALVLGALTMFVSSSALAKREQ